MDSRGKSSPGARRSLLQNKNPAVGSAADLYHILPRPDGRHWDGVEYYDPSSGKGMTALFKPKSDVITQMIHFKGLDPAHRYGLSFEATARNRPSKSLAMS